jgi:hypothetical protein
MPKQCFFAILSATPLKTISSGLSRLDAEREETEHWREAYSEVR